MSGDVQPRKRKDKRRRKDELSVEEPRGTAAVFGEGDVFMHSQHEHGTGGHWCAKVIFFSLLAVLVTLIGLIILENRGLSELEANAVESRYSGVLEGWLEDSPDDDHHDVHTLELKHHDEEDDEQGDVTDDEHHDDDIEQNDEAHEDASDSSDERDEDEHNGDNDEDEIQHDGDENEDRDQEDDDEDGDQNIDSAELEDDEDERNFRKYYKNLEQDDDDDEDDDSKDDNDYHDEQNDDESNENDEHNDDSIEEGNNKSAELNNDDDEDDESNQQLGDDEDEEDRDNESNEYEESYATRQSEEEGNEDDPEEDTDLEVEKIEKEVSDEYVLQEADADNSEEDKSAEKSDEDIPDDDQTADEEEFLELEDIEEPVVVERITAPAGKPLPEVEEETSSEKPLDTLEEEEEYEKQQEEIRRQKEQQASHMWLKVVVGGALLVATHAVIHRATAPRDPILSAERDKRDESPSAVDRRMMLIPEEPYTVTEEPEEIPSPTIVRQVEKVSSAITKTVPLPSVELEEEEDEELDFETKNVQTAEPDNDDEDKELYSDEEIEEEIEQEVEVIKEIPKQSIPETKQKTGEPKEMAKTIKPEIEPDEEVPEDVEIIDDEQLEEEIVEEEDEEDISDVDDAELLSRLEAKYGRLPEPERPTPKKDGGNNVEEDWPGEPSDQYWRQQLDEAERELRQGSWFAAEERAAAGELRGSARARYVRARALDAAAEARRDNALLSRSIAAYLELLKMNERLSDKKLLEVTNRTLDRIRFRGNYINAEPVYRLLIRRFPNDPSHRNNLTIAFLMANRPDLAEEVLKETLRLWPDDRVALAHLGFILKTTHNKLEEAVEAIRKALEGDIGAANEPRFYFHLGDALLLLGRFEEAHEVHKRGAKLGHFLSPSQRSLYNVDRLKSQPWWDVEQTPYHRLARALEGSWQTILKEGEAARALYEQEKEGLKERGEWSQLDLFVRGQELPGRCKRAPVTCSIVRQEIAAVGCKRGQIKFSSMEAGTHVRPHVGPTNCRLRMHLGLSNTKDTYIRVDKETRQWQVGKVLLFDDSFEHEVWHNGTGARLVLIVDVWHPDLTHAERRHLPAI